MEDHSKETRRRRGTFATKVGNKWVFLLLLHLRRGWLTSAVASNEPDTLSIAIQVDSNRAGILVEGGSVWTSHYIMTQVPSTKSDNDSFITQNYPPKWLEYFYPSIKWPVTRHMTLAFPFTIERKEEGEMSGGECHRNIFCLVSRSELRACSPTAVPKKTTGRR